MTRYPDWASRLEVFLLEQTEREFRYGSWDCCLFVCDAIRIMTGVDPSGDFRGRYGARRVGRELLRNAGGIAAIARAWGMPEISPMRARRGDVVMLRRTCLGLVALNGHEALAIGESGLMRVPVNMALRAWAV